MSRYIDTEKIHITANLMADEMGEIYVSLTDVRKSIDQTPTADVVEVRHGEWKCIGKTIKYNDTHIEERCSICSRHVKRASAQPQEKYCPNCGARMDGERSDNDT